MYICSPLWKDQRIRGINGKDNSARHSMMACSVHTEPAYVLWDLTTYCLPVSRLVQIFSPLVSSFDRGSASSNSKSESTAVGLYLRFSNKRQLSEWFNHSRREQGLIHSLLVSLKGLKDAWELWLWFPITSIGEPPLRKRRMLSYLDSVVMPFGINISDIRKVLEDESVYDAGR